MPHLSPFFKQAITGFQLYWPTFEQWAFAVSSPKHRDRRYLDYKNGAKGMHIIHEIGRHTVVSIYIPRFEFLSGFQGLSESVSMGSEFMSQWVDSMPP